MTKKYTYYPGCSAKGLAKSYEKSFLAVFKALDIEVQELDNWNCCGATAYMSVDEEHAFLLSARNMALAEQLGSDMIAPCSACYLTHNKAKGHIKKYSHIGQKITKVLKETGKLDYAGKVKVRHPLDVLVNDIGIDKIKEKIKNPLKGLKVAPYYGCQIVRPIGEFDDETYPTTMDKLLQAIGAEVPHYPLKTKCCGGSLTGTISEVGERLCYILLREAQVRGAHLMTTVCPLCQFNLDAYQDKISKKYEKVNMPIVYFTQLLGTALGIPAKELGYDEQIISAKPALREKALIA